MHTKQWQAVCGFVTDVCESVTGPDRTMRALFDRITEDKARPIYGWCENGRPAWMRRDVFRRSVVSVARKLTEYLPEPHGIVGLHLENGPFWPVFYWAILMSGHTPLVLDHRRELFSYRSLREFSGVCCISRDQNYPAVVDPGFLQKSRSEVDSAFFDQLWTDETVFVAEKPDGALEAVTHDGLSLSEAFRRLRHAYRYDQPLFYPPEAGPARVSLGQPFSDPFGFLCGVILFPCFGYEVFTADPKGDARSYLSLTRSLAVTHHCLSAEGCGAMAAAVQEQIERSFPRDAHRFAAWLRGEERINDYRTLARYMALAVKLKNTVFGKKAGCVLCADDGLDGTAALFLHQLGLFFARGYCPAELGLVSLELSGDPQMRTKNSVGLLLDGVTGTITDHGKLALDGGRHVGRPYSPDVRRAYPSPFVTDRTAAFDPHGRLCLLSEGTAQKRAAEPADPETVRRMRELYALVLNKPVEIIEDDMDFFFALGGDSLSYFLLLQHVEMQFGIKIKPEERIYFSTARYAAQTLRPYLQQKGGMKNNA